MPPAFEVLLLNTTIPQIQAAQSGDTYVVPRDIAFSAALTLSAGTANGVPYLNASKVLTTGSALTFDGTGLANALNNNTPKYISVSYSTVPAYFSNSFDGSVGLSTLSNNTWNNSNGSASWASFANTGYSASAIQFATSTGASDIRFLTASAANTNPTEAMRLTSTGLGIGTNNPQYKLDVAATSAGNPIASMTRNEDNTNAASNAVVRIRTGGSSSGDPFLLFTIDAQVDYSIGLDNSVSDALVFSRSGALGTNNQMALDSSGNLTPGADNTQTLGSASYRWSVVYAGTGTINTSDAREKTAVRELSAAEISAAKQLAAEIGAYQFLSAVETKGDAAREHIGMTVQRAIEIMEANNLDPFNYGFICHDEWEDTFEDVVDPTGDLVRTVTRQKTVKQTVGKTEVKVIDGVARLVTTSEEIDVPQWKELQVVDANGSVVMVVDQPAKEAVLDKSGDVIEPAVEATYKPMTHRIEDMETVEEKYRKKLVQAAGDRYSFRPDELLLFVARGFEARLASLEK